MDQPQQKAVLAPENGHIVINGDCSPVHETCRHNCNPYYASYHYGTCIVKCMMDHGCYKA